MGPTTLFTHLKIILLQCFQFQFSVSAKISSIQTHPLYQEQDMQFPYYKETLVHKMNCVFINFLVNTEILIKDTCGPQVSALS